MYCYFICGLNGFFGLYQVMINLYGKHFLILEFYGNIKLCYRMKISEIDQ